MNNWKKLRLFLQLSWGISPAYWFFLMGNALVASGQILANVIFPKYLINELVIGKNPKKLFLYGSIIVISNVVFALLVKTFKRLLEVKNEYVRDCMEKEMARKIMEVDFSYLENPYYLDLKERAVFAIANQNCIQGLIEAVAKILTGIVTLTGLIVIMTTLSWVLIVLLLVTLGITLGIMKGFKSYQYQFMQEIIPVNRKYGYYVGQAYDDVIQKDIRMYGMSQMMTDTVTKYNIEINHWFKRFHYKQGMVQGKMEIINQLQAALAYGYVGLRVVSSKFGTKISIGSFSMYVAAVLNFTSTMYQLIDTYLKVKQSLEYLTPFMEFMELPEEKKVMGKKELVNEISSIRFEHVSFSYPGSKTKVLEDVSFEIKKGEKISIVGLNGAGKTTLIKLLCRLYHPDEGNIYINGVNIFDYDYQTYMKKIAAVFQDYKIFAFSIEENITCNVDAQSKRNHKIVEKVLKEVDMMDKVNELPRGVQTCFGKAYDEEGIELSGGQGQKIAIARALYKDASFIILDEPTSALDPIAEADIYQKFNRLVQDKTAIYISHRMSSSVFCDRVLILDQGRVADFDTHQNLMEKKDSLYYQLFQSQAENYKVN